MNDVVYWIMYAVMLLSLGLNIYGCFLSAKSWKRAKKQWEIAGKMVSTIDEIRDEAKVEIAREILADIRAKGGFSDPFVEYICLGYDELLELEKKYIPDQES